MAQDPTKPRPLTVDISGLTQRERAEFEERAAIREFDGKQSQAVAEAGALLEVMERRHDPKYIGL